MWKRLLACVAALTLLSPALPSDAATRSTSHRSATRTSTKGTTQTSKSSARNHKAKASVPRNNKGRIARSGEAKHQFEVQSGYPHGRPGYVVDHIRPLACGGADAPSNMQWQTVAEAKAKDRVERKGC